MGGSLGDTTYECAEGAGTTAVLGVGACEQHSHHLPLETDYLLSLHLGRAVAERLGAFLLNPLPYSTSLCHRGFAGTVTLRPDTLRRVVWEIAESVESWGVRYLLLVNCHGGNFVLDPTVREWNMDDRSPFLIMVDGFSGIADLPGDLHSGEGETSIMLYLEPEAVRMDRAVDFVPEHPREDLRHLGMRGISPEGVWGRATAADAVKGKAWFAAAVDRCVDRYEMVRTAFDAGAVTLR